MAQLIGCDQRQGLTAMPMHFDFNGALEAGFFSTECLAQTPVELRIAGLPEPVADMHLFEGNITLAKREGRFGSAHLNGVNSAAFLLLVRSEEHTSELQSRFD